MGTWIFRKDEESVGEELLEARMAAGVGCQESEQFSGRSVAGSNEGVIQP